MPVKGRRVGPAGSAPREPLMDHCREARGRMEKHGRIRAPAAGTELSLQRASGAQLTGGPALPAPSSGGLDAVEGQRGVEVPA